MRRKNFLLFILTLTLFFLFVDVKSQSKSSDPQDLHYVYERKITPEIIENLKKTKTVFFTSNIAPHAVDTFKSMIKSTWTFTPIIFDEIENFEKYEHSLEYSFFEIRSSLLNPKIPVMQYYLTLFYVKEVKKKYDEKIGLSRIELYPDINHYGTGYGIRDKDRRDYRNKHFRYYNSSPVLLKAQLMNLQFNLSKNIRPGYSNTIKIDDLTSKLQSDTLYIPRVLLVDYNIYSEKAMKTDEDVFKSYPYNYKICDDDELYKIFIEENRGRFLFEFVKTSRSKFIQIYDMKEGRMIYKKYTPQSHKIKGKDLEKLD